VINNIADPRPTLETYKYWMPGEKDAPIDHVYLFDVTAQSGKELPVAQFKDQSIATWAAPQKQIPEMMISVPYNGWEQKISFTLHVPAEI